MAKTISTVVLVVFVVLLVFRRRSSHSASRCAGGTAETIERWWPWAWFSSSSTSSDDDRQLSRAAMKSFVGGLLVRVTPSTSLFSISEDIPPTVSTRMLMAAIDSSLSFFRTCTIVVVMLVPVVESSATTR